MGSQPQHAQTSTDETSTSLGKCQWLPAITELLIMALIVGTKIELQ